AEAEAKHGKSSELAIAAREHAARALAGAGRKREARAAHEEALRAAEDAFGRDDPRVSEPQAGLAALHAAEGDASNAVDLFERALVLRVRKGPTHPELCELVR